VEKSVLSEEKETELESDASAAARFVACVLLAE
jgi:hypothetical protein